MTGGKPWGRPQAIPLHPCPHTAHIPHTPHGGMPFPFPSSPFPSPGKLVLVQLQGQDRQWKPCGPGSSSEAFTPGCGFELMFWPLVLFPSHTRGLLSDCFWAHLAGKCSARAHWWGCPGPVSLRTQTGLMAPGGKLCVLGPGCPPLRSLMAPGLGSLDCGCFYFMVHESVLACHRNA